VKKFSK